MNRDTFSLLLWAAAGALLAGPAAARDAPPLPAIAIDPIAASGLLSAAEPRRPAAPSPRLELIDAGRAGLLQEPAWRLERDNDWATGKRARLSLPLAGGSVFAFGGKLTRRSGPARPDPVAGPSPLSGSRIDGGKIYGAGIARRVGGVEVSASYQYSRLGGGDADQGLVDVDRSAHAHALTATARIRLRP